MENDKEHSAVAWAKAYRLELEDQLTALKSGRFRLWEKTEDGEVDFTAKAIERVEHLIVEIDRLLSGPLP